MSDANVVKLLQPGSFADPLTEVLRNGARALLDLPHFSGEALVYPVATRSN